MYETFFGLDTSPFAMTPDPRFLYRASAHNEALDGLTYAITSGKGFTVLMGEPGTGKTTLLRALPRSLPPESACFSFVFNPTVTPNEFLGLALKDFQISPLPHGKAGRILKLQQFLQRVREQGKRAVLAVDEAHKLSPDVFEEIRLLTNFESPDNGQLLQVVIAGQPELAETLNREDLRQVKQRIAVRLAVGPLPSTEIDQYLRHRWAMAGGAGPLPFGEGMVDHLMKFSHGIPRVLNALCDNALLLAFRAGASEVTPDHVVDAATRLDLVNGDNRWRPPEDLIRTLPVRLKLENRVLLFDDADGKAAEQYRIVRAKLSQHPSHPRIIEVSSPGQGDGKTMTAINVAAALALNRDASVLLVDGDLRRSTISSVLGLPNSPGLADVLAGSCSSEEALIRVEQLPHLTVLPAGRPTSNPAELLQSPRWLALVDDLRRQFGFVIVDAPPVGAVADHELIQVACEGVILVIRPDHTNRTLSRQVTESIAPEKLLGVLLNCVDESCLSNSYNSSYYYYSGNTPEAVPSGTGFSPPVSITGRAAQ